MNRILFVCTGNTCRSPMAEAILKNKNIHDLEVKSAGIYAANGASASQHTQKVLEENRIFHEHQSSMLTEEIVNWATLILTMTQNHKNAMIHMFPQARKKTFTIKEFASEEDGDILDPFGGPIQIYRATYEDLSANIEEIMKKLDLKKGEDNGGKEGI